MNSFFKLRPETVLILAALPGMQALALIYFIALVRLIFRKLF